MSSTVFRGFLLGLAVTAVIQSSSATTVMVFGFVNSGIMTLKQAVGVIMGANIGTTVTAWNIAVIHTCFNVAATCVLMPMNGLLVKLSGMNLSVSDNRILNTLLYTVADLERITVPMWPWRSCRLPRANWRRTNT